MKKSELKRIVKAMSQRTLDEMRRLYLENADLTEEVEVLTRQRRELIRENGRLWKEKQALEANQRLWHDDPANLATQVERMAQTINNQDKLINKLKGITP